VRIVVVGSGVVGLLTAMECVRAGAQVSLVDQAGIPSPLATSNDRQRVVRALYRSDARLTAAAAQAHLGWLEVERRLGGWFYHRVGALTAMPAGEVESSLALLAAAGASGRPLSAGDLSAHYPRIRFPAGLGAVLEPVTGIVLADRALTAMRRWLGCQPAVRLYPRHRVVAVDEGGAVLLADGAVLAGDRVVVAAGPWSRDLLAAELTLYRQSVLWYATAPSAGAWAGTPAILAVGNDHGAWLIPPVAGAPARLSAASACRMVPEMTDRVTPDYWRDHLMDQFAQLLADFDPAAVVGASDGYYLADPASGGPLLGMLGDGTVVAYAACGGMSFKFAPLIARAIADRMAGQPPRPVGLEPIDHPRQLAATAAAVSRDGDQSRPKEEEL
jgi:glycine/D-amino acid oxidase-like deaminating enzyme